MIKTKKELIEEFINNARGKILWDQACLKSLDVQIQEREIKSIEDEFTFQKIRNDLLADIENNTRMLGIFTKILKEKKDGTTKAEVN